MSTTSSLPLRLTSLPLYTIHLLALTLAFYILPLTIQHLVLPLDATYELLSRRARSPYTDVSWLSVISAVVLMLGWSVWLGRLGYGVVLESGAEGEGEGEGEGDGERREVLGEEDGGSKRDGNGKGKGHAKQPLSWSRVLGRIVIPVLLGFFAVRFVCEVGWRLGTPRLVVKGGMGG